MQASSKAGRPLVTLGELLAGGLRVRGTTWQITAIVRYQLPPEPKEKVL
jgi:hypothetical protein